MNPALSQMRPANESDKTSTKSHTFVAEWFNEIEKRKAIENNTYPQLQSIKENLGVNLAQLVIEMIPEHIMREIVSNIRINKIPHHFGVTAENMLSNDIKLTPLQDYDDEHNTSIRKLNTVLRIGDRLKNEVAPKWEDELNDELELKISEYEKEKKDNIAVEILNIRCTEVLNYESDTQAVVEKYNYEFLEMKKSIEEYNINEYEIEVDRKLTRLCNNMNKLLNASLKKIDKKHISAFLYHMQLARNEVFEEFQNEKLKLEYQWDSEMEKLKKEHETALERLQTRLETEHTQDIFELERWYENEIAKLKADDKRRKEAMSQDAVDDGSLVHTLTMRRIDDELSGKRDEIIVYKKRLEYILSGYVDFVENNVRVKLTLMRRHLDQAKRLTEKLKETEIAKECDGNVTCNENPAP